jgi:dihydroorotate dehydrogenase
MKKIDAVDTDKPICIKLSPDMNLDTVDRFLEISRLHRVHGIICSNLTKDTSVVSTQDTTPPRGGMSGKAVFPKAVALLSHMYKKSQDRFVFIYSGGIFTADDVYMVMRSGAHLVQLITGMVFEGPQLIGELNRGLVNRMKRDGVTSVQDIVGVDCR